MDFTAESSGAQIIAASSFDSRYPPECVIDGDETTFWATTGSFPQEIVIQLSSSAILTKIQTWTMHARSIRIELSDSPTAKKWTKLPSPSDAVIQDRESLQIETHEIDREDATFVKIVIEAGWTDFVTLHKVTAQGKTSTQLANNA